MSWEELFATKKDKRGHSENTLQAKWLFLPISTLFRQLLSLFPCDFLNGPKLLSLAFI